METKFSSRDLNQFAKHNYGRLACRGRLRHLHSRCLRIGRLLGYPIPTPDQPFERRTDWRNYRHCKLLKKVFYAPRHKRRSVRLVKAKMMDCVICPTATKNGRNCNWVSVLTTQFHLISKCVD